MIAAPTIGRCEDCERSRELDEHGCCSVCGSASVFVSGAVREVFARIVEREPSFRFGEGFRL